MPIRIVVSLAVIRAKRPLRALADVALEGSEGEITIRRCAVFEKEGQPPWASLPRLQVEKNGRKQFVPLIELSRDFKKRVLDAVLAEYKVKSDAR
jgi:hypothetical protein